MYHISTEEIEYFLTVANTCNFSDAANTLYVSQPTITKWIKRLEKDLGMKLFLRSTKHVQLTPAGKMLYQKWLPIFNQLQESIDEAQKITQSMQMHLNIGLLFGFSYDDYLNPILAALHLKYPHIKVNISVLNFAELKQAFNEQQLDIIFSIADESASYEDTVSKVIGSDLLYLAMSAYHPLAFHDRIDASLLQDMEFHCLAKQTAPGLYKHMRQLLDSFLSSYQLIESINLPSLQSIIRNSNGLTITNDQFPANSSSIILKPFLSSTKTIIKVCYWHKKQTKYSSERFLRLMKHNIFSEDIMQ